MKRRKLKRRPARREWAVLLFPVEQDGPKTLWGPVTRQGALAVSLRELTNGRTVQLVRWPEAGS